MECGVGKRANSMVNKSKNNDRYKDLSTMINTNLTWYILKEKTGSAFSNDRQLKEFIMTLVGTMIIGENDLKTVLPSLDRQSVIKALLNGGQTEIYVCDEEKNCLNPVRREITIDQNSGLHQRVLLIMNSILSKVENDSPELTQNEKNFVDSTSIPILKYMIDPMSIATTRMLMVDIAKHISYDTLHQYLSETISAYSVAASNTNLPEPTKKELQLLILTANRQLQDVKANISIQESQMLKLEQQMQYIRTQASTNLLSNFMANYDYN